MTEHSFETPPQNCKNKLAILDAYVTQIVRGVAVVCLLASILYETELQLMVNQLWFFLYNWKPFNSVYFETIWVTVSYTVIISAYPFTLSYIKCFDRYKIHPSVGYEHQTIVSMVTDLFVYVTPLIAADTWKIKYHFGGVDQRLWEERQTVYIQTTVALPVAPPTPFQVGYQLLGSIVVYDILFFLIHYTMHKNFFLYKHIHLAHHNHEFLHGHVSNRLNIVERGILIVAANYSLKAVGSHPLTRALFVPIFVFLIIDSHTGYDFPWSLNRVVPFGLYGGSVKHYSHHVNGAPFYEPFFTYLDKVLAIKRLTPFRKKGM